MHADLERILLHRDQIQRRVHAMAQEIADAYLAQANELTIVPILAGSIIFTADLIREIPIRLKIALVQLSTYRGATPGTPSTVMDLLGDLAGRHVLLIDDILDTGRSIRHAQSLILSRGAASLRTAVLLRKPAKAPADLRVDFVGFDIEDAFVVGYGLDYQDYYRNLPHIGVLRQ